MKEIHNYSRLAKMLVQAIFVFAIAGAISMAPASFAQGNGNDPLAIKLEAKKVVTVDGKETMESGDKAKPGDVIEYSAIYKNNTGGKISNLKPTLPIPKGMEYIVKTAKPAPIEASLDGETYAKLPIMREVTTADGKKEMQEVPASEFRALRWSVGSLGSGASTTMVARVHVSATATPRK